MVVNIGLGTNYPWMLKVDKEPYGGGLSPDPPMHSSISKNEPPHFYVSWCHAPRNIQHFLWSILVWKNKTKPLSFSQVSRSNHQFTRYSGTEEQIKQYHKKGWAGGPGCMTSPFILLIRAKNWFHKERCFKGFPEKCCKKYTVMMH